MLLSDAVNPVAVRHESGLRIDLIGVGDVREFDAITVARIKARSTFIAVKLDHAAGQYAWPFTEAVQSTLWPLRSPEERAKAVSEQTSLAADCVRAYVLGDLYMRAAQKDPAYIEKAKVYFAQGKDLLDAAILSVKTAGDEAGGGTDPSTTAGGILKLVRIILPGGPGNHRRFGGNEYGRDDYKHNET